MKMKVKTLKWEKETSDTDVYINAYVGIARYTIVGELTDDTVIRYRAVFGFGNSRNVIPIELFDDIATAKEACQKHFEELILSGVVDLDELFIKHKEEVENSEPTGFEQWKMEYNGYKETTDES